MCAIEKEMGSVDFRECHELANIDLWIIHFRQVNTPVVLVVLFLAMLSYDMETRSKTQGGRETLFDHVQYVSDITQIDVVQKQESVLIQFMYEVILPTK